MQTIATAVLLASAAAASNLRSSSSSSSSSIYTSPIQCFGPFDIMCWQHTTDTAAGTVTFNATCTEAFFEKVGWCAFGLSLANSGSMGNAEVFFVSVLSSGVVSIEDRFNPKGHDAPICVTQSLTGASGAVSSANGAVTAKWTRPLNASGSGYASITPGATLRMIAAWGSASRQEATPCQTGWKEHSYTGSGSTTF